VNLAEQTVCHYMSRCTEQSVSIWCCICWSSSLDMVVAPRMSLVVVLATFHVAPSTLMGGSMVVMSVFYVITVNWGSIVISKDIHDIQYH
jgi:hypothetical protein